MEGADDLERRDDTVVELVKKGVGDKFKERSKPFKGYWFTRSLRPIAPWRSARVMTIVW